MPKASGKGKDGASTGAKSQKWIAKDDKVAAAKAAPAPITPEVKEEEVITSPILLAPSVGPKYTRMDMLRYFSVFKKAEEAEEAEEGEAISKTISVTERPAGEGVVEGSKTPTGRSKQERDKKKEMKIKKQSSQEISLSQELPPESVNYGAMAPEMAWYLNSMYGGAPMTPMYSPGYTTVMLRNIPNRYSRDMLIKRLEDGYKDQFDFVYLPIDFNSKCNVGYAFINFRTPTASQRFVSEFHGHRTKIVLPGFSSTKVCEVSFARVQGRDANMENLRDEKFIEKLAERPEWQPLFYNEKGEEIPFHQTLGSGKPRTRSRGDSVSYGTPASPSGARPMVPPMTPMTPGAGYFPGYPGSPMAMGMFPPNMAFGAGVPSAQGGGPPVISAVLTNTSGMLMVRGVPSSLTTSQFVEAVDKAFKGQYDLIFLPPGEDGGNRGFGFINFKKKAQGETFTAKLNGEKPSAVLGVPAADEEKALEVVPARMNNVDKIFRTCEKNAKTKNAESSTWLPLLFGNDGQQIPYPMLVAPPMVPQEAAPKAKAKGKAKAKAAATDGEATAGKGAKGKKGGPPPPPNAPPPPIAGQGYPPYGYPFGYPGMPPVHPQYAAAMAQAAHAHARAAAAAHAGQTQQQTGKLQSGLLDNLAAAVNRGPKVPLDEEQRKALRGQIEFYFSVDNLCKDVFLRSHMDPEGWTPMELITQFPQVRKYRASQKDINESLKSSEILEVDPTSAFMRLKDQELRTKWAQVPDEYRQSLPAKPKKAGKGGGKAKGKAKAEAKAEAKSPAAAAPPAAAA